MNNIVCVHTCRNKKWNIFPTVFIYIYFSFMFYMVSLLLFSEKWFYICEEELSVEIFLFCFVFVCFTVNWFILYYNVCLYPP